MKGIMKSVRDKAPLVHNITNYVTVNDCANIILAAGGSPLMADDIEEVEEIVAISNALYINIGTLNKRTIESMVVAGKAANRKGIPVVLDPVGIGASDLRNRTVERLLEEVEFSVIKGNMSEIKCIFQKSRSSSGVDVQEEDMINSQNIEESGAFAQKVSRTFGCVIVITGSIDIVAHKEKIAYIKNGHALMSRITGTGCMLGSVVATYCGANKESIFEGVISAVALMGMAGEYAAEKVEKRNEGTGSFRSYLIDGISLIDGEYAEEGAEIEIK